MPIACTCPLRPDASVLMFDDIELAGGKVKAFFDRVKVRDLYDISNLAKYFDGVEGEKETLIHRTMLYHASLSARFPQPFVGRSDRFADRQSEFEDQLIPMLRQNGENPTLQELMADAEDFVKRLILPRTAEDQEYLDRFANGDFRPELLFPDQTMAEAAAKSPEALWKLRNLKKMQRS